MWSRILSFYTRYFAVWVVLGGIAAYLYPAVFLALKNYNESFFMLTMFGIGAVLETEDFRRIARQPAIVLIGSAAQFILMPFGAFALAKLFHLPPEITVGLILTGAAPGAMASNVMSYIAKADVAYSVSLTTVSTLLCPLMTPGLTYLLARSTLEVDFWAMFVSVIQMVILPLLVGMLIRYKWERQVRQILPVFPAISATFIIFICALVIAANRNYLPQLTLGILITSVLLNVYGMAAGYGVGGLFHMDVKRRRTLSIEIGMQNAGLGTVLALKHFGERAAIPVAIFVFICIITASLAAAWWARGKSPDGREKPEESSIKS